MLPDRYHRIMKKSYIMQYTIVCLWAFVIKIFWEKMQFYGGNA